LQTEEFKASIKNKKNQGKASFFERSIKVIIMKKKKTKQIKTKQIYIQNGQRKKTKKDNVKRTKQ